MRKNEKIPIIFWTRAMFTNIIENRVKDCKVGVGTGRVIGTILKRNSVYSFLGNCPLINFRKLETSQETRLCMKQKNECVLGNYEPRAVLQFFEQICRIPHGSGNTAAISDWVVSLAKERQLEYEQDPIGNIIIRKPASAGYEAEDTIILQGHMDMVAVKTADCPLNLEQDPLQLRVEGDLILADQTSLGGDDGIAIAYMLAVLADDSLAHPALECLFTTDEEVGLQGISKMDVSGLKGRKLLNMDTEDEGVLMAGCAGGVKTICRIPVEWEESKGCCYRLSIEGLNGGHSGMEIHKEYGNGNLLLGRVLYQMRKEVSIRLAALSGGEKDNAIPNSAQAVIVSADPKEDLKQCTKAIYEQLKTELYGKENRFILRLEPWEHRTEMPEKVLSEASFHKICLCLMVNPNGVQSWSASIPGVVETSLNCGIMRLEQEAFLVRYALRSSVKSAKEFLKNRITEYIKILGGTVEYEGDYPPWEYLADSPFRDKMCRIYEGMYGKKMEIQVIHAGLECGYLSEQLPGLDCVSIGPDMKNIHTTEETLSLASVKRVWEFLLEVLKDRETK